MLNTNKKKLTQLLEIIILHNVLHFWNFDFFSLTVIKFFFNAQSASRVFFNSHSAGKPVESLTSDWNFVSYSSILSGRHGLL